MNQQPDPLQTAPEGHGVPVRDPADVFTAAPPSHIGRYRVVRLLGEGSFGRVYLAHDEQLQRPVAIKVPHPERVERPEDADAYLTEARTVANLDHPHIVPVHDVGSTPEFPFFVVSKYIEGSDLKRRLKESRPTVLEAVELTATVAETLHYAHRKGLVHRDIKPGNILLDQAGKPYVADFGLALREEDVGKGPRFAGTPAYMSPEQARGEGHRVDGRSDIFSLGIVLYELLTARRPFPGQTCDEVLERITSLEARPLRQWDDAIPRELERICLKALAKRAADRYLTAGDMAEDLRSLLEQSTAEERELLRSHVALGDGVVPTPLPSPVATPGPDSEPVRIVPKGLRSFDAGDADFFLELLPGPRDRGGLPESIRFWKARVEEQDAEKTFSVGLIYGPSGCGKSSLVKAGLLPRLAQAVTAVYVEATAEDTEARLLNGLRRQLPALPDNLGLVESLAALRKGRCLRPGEKVLVVLDQFEQWLHASPGEENRELVQALRHCDGGRLQGVVLVRDDFWMAATRFMAKLEVDLVQGQNCAAVDLFDPLHARKLLAAFGRAYGRLPDNLGQCSKEQDAFLDQAVAGLSQDGKVISVRLALFAEMVKGRPWIPATLKEVGGIAGVGVTFLEETFTASTAPPPHRLHQKAAQAVLKALLPEAGTDIKGNLRSRQQLLDASGYAGRPKDFADLLRILDGELRLITPADPEGADPASVGASARRDDSGSTSGLRPDARQYQLTHDYLVPSLRDWLTRKQKQTRRGRAELRLAERAAAWHSKPETRHLPAWWEWAGIRLYTRPRDWTPPQRKMMHRAGRYHAVRSAAALLLLGLLLLGGVWTFGALEARSRVDNLLTARTADVPGIVRGLGPYRRWADPLLREKAAQADLDADKRLRLALALLPADSGQVDYLADRLLDADGPEEVRAIRDLLHEHAPDSMAPLWSVLQDDRAPRPGRLRAASALALSDEADPRWSKIGDDVVRCLASENVLLLRDWAELLWPVRAHLVPHASRRLIEADTGGFSAFLALLRAYPEEAADALHAVLDRKPPAAAKPEDREALARQQAQAAVALIHLGRTERVWPLFHQTEDPTRRTYLIHACAAYGVDPTVLADGLQVAEADRDGSVYQGLLLALGEYGPDQRAELVRGPLVDRILYSYQYDPDPGVHSSAEWRLRRWQRTDQLAKADQAIRARVLSEREVAELVRGLRHADPQLRSRSASALEKQEQVPGSPIPLTGDKPRWYVNGQGQTFVVLPAPGKFWIGSPPGEKGRFQGEDRREVRIDYAFAVAAKLVTVAEFKKCWPDFKHEAAQWSPGPDTPVNGVNWYDAARYCNWLSEQEKIPQDQWCYEKNAKGEYAEGMRVKPNYQHLQGYRLPREAEWEYACRAGTVTAWSHGSDEALLRHYAWYNQNAGMTMHRVGSLKPNGLGLFDMHGNAWQWCQEVYEEKDNKDIENVINEQARLRRGGAFNDVAGVVRSACRFSFVPLGSYYEFGFRVARTFTP